jgi:hypothetical protein
MFERQICHTRVTDVLQFTFIVKVPHPTSKRLCGWLAKIACFWSKLITLLYAGSRMKIASKRLVSYIHFPSVKIALHPIPQTKPSGVRTGDTDSCISITTQNYKRLYTNIFFSQWPILSALNFWRFLLNCSVAPTLRFQGVTVPLSLCFYGM